MIRFPAELLCRKSNYLLVLWCTILQQAAGTGGTYSLSRFATVVARLLSTEAFAGFDGLTILSKT
jgi:hypothetical protein